MALLPKLKLKSNRYQYQRSKSKSKLISISIKLSGSGKCELSLDVDVMHAERLSRMLCQHWIRYRKFDLGQIFYDVPGQLANYESKSLTYEL